MTPDDIRLENFEILRFRYLQNASYARRGRERILELHGSQSLAKLLRSHLVEEVEEPDTTKRAEIDELLAFYAMLEVATISGYVPATLPADFVEETLHILSESSVERFYARFYPLLLVQLFDARLRGRFSVPISLTSDASRAFIRLLDISELLKIEEVETFLTLLDDGVIDDENFEDVVEKVQTPAALAKALTTLPDERTPSEMAVQGFRSFTAFCRQLDALLHDLRPTPFLQSAFWHYHGYWLHELSGTVLGALSMAIEQQRNWVTLDPIPATDEEMAQVRRTHASMDRTELVLQRLTSGIYRAHVEAFYFDKEFQSWGSRNK